MKFANFIYETERQQNCEVEEESNVGAFDDPIRR